MTFGHPAWNKFLDSVTLSSLTRTLRELNGLLGQHRVAADDDDDGPDDIDEVRRELARRMNAFVDARTGKADGGAGPQSA